MQSVFTGPVTVYSMSDLLGMALAFAMLVVVLGCVSLNWILVALGWFGLGCIALGWVDFGLVGLGCVWLGCGLAPVLVS